MAITAGRLRMLTGPLVRPPRRGAISRPSSLASHLGLLCPRTGWLAPRGAGRLESRNVGEYDTCRAPCRGLRPRDLVDCLLTMAEVSVAHEHYFRRPVPYHARAAASACVPAPAAAGYDRATHEVLAQRFGGRLLLPLWVLAAAPSVHPPLTRPSPLPTSAPPNPHVVLPVLPVPPTVTPTAAAKG